ncbi:hypothetical protein AVEN_48186-1 [Araneus ventricosus]|uniref:Uncharacterized protein n=1 Tax=Araneus ventricosus TaxID=182803 RepID=A0A4Y2J7E7_ARAVE|nr:hypothetical protein AVEN_48186-1 [Araneus ventricosus]
MKPPVGAIRGERSGNSLVIRREPVTPLGLGGQFCGVSSTQLQTDHLLKETTNVEIQMIMQSCKNKMSPQRLAASLGCDSRATTSKGTGFFQEALTCFLDFLKQQKEKRKRKKGKSMIATDTPMKDEIAQRLAESAKKI